MYHVFVHSLAERVLGHIRRQELLKAGDRVGVAVSGGIDSVALLRLLLELRGDLGIVVSIVHFNHKLRGAESDADERFVGELARAHGPEFHCDGDDVAEHARAEGVSLETAARELRYGFFRSLICPDDSPQEVGISTLSQTARQEWGTPLGLDKIVTGHTLDDQAETVLMRLIRGAGLRGLGGIHPRIALEDDKDEAGGEIVRPLLAFRRRELEAYLNDIGQPWREDATNSDEKFTRNRIRKLVLPLLEKEFNPSVAENLAELAEIARGEEDYWENEVAGWMGTGVHWSEPEWARRKTAADGLVQIALSVEGSISPAQNAREVGQPGIIGSEVMAPEVKALEIDDLQSRIDAAPWLVMNASVDRVWFLGEPAAVQRRLIKAVGENAGVPLEFKHIEEILRSAGESGGTGKELSLPLGWKLVRKPDELVFVTPDLREPNRSEDYQYELPIPGRVELPELGVTIEARRVRSEAAAGYNPEQLLDADSLPGPLRVRNWRAGDRFWPSHTKSPKKIKELLQERHVAQPERKLWPVVIGGNEIVWLRGFPVPAQFRAKPGREAVVILETSHAGGAEM
jgi:tRNA(Ile)-lysidine synthase